MFASTKKPLQVRMGKEKEQLIVGFIVLVNAYDFEISRQNISLSV